MKVGERDVVSSGVLVTQGGDDTVQITQADLTFTLRFHEDGGEPSVRGEGEGKSLTVHLSNFGKSILGTSWHSEVGQLKNRRLYLALHVASVGQSEKVTRSITFTLSLGGPIDG